MQQMHFLHRIRRKILGETVRGIMLSEYSSPKLMSFVVILIALFAESAHLVETAAAVPGDQSAVNSLINLQKRVDYRTCIDRFEVHRDTIIQTDDSRAMGATFLYHVEAANRDECLRDCCETDRCDVFVFEEKYQGSCFLFQCGPPTDFRCQFASHANYSIAVLSMQRYTKPQAPAIPLQSHESQQVTQLKILKGLEMAGKSLEQPPATQAPTTTTTTTTTTPSPTTAAVCGRFQFQCHSGECIAIYNACDGIPQCEDGSDETPACPSQAAAGVLNNNKKHSSQLESIRANNPPAAQLHRTEEHNGNNFASRPNPYAGKVYEGPEGMSADGGYMSGTIEKPPPLRNREDPVSAAGRYYNSQVPQQQQIQSLRNLPMQVQQQQQQSQDAMNGNNLLYSSSNSNNNNNDPMNRLPGSNPPLGRPVDNNFYSGGYRDKYYYPSNGNNNQQQDQSPLQPVFINGQSNELRPWHSPLDSANANPQYNNFPSQQQPQPPPFYLPSNNNGNNWPNAIENKNLPPVAPNSIPSGQQSVQRLPPANSAPPSIPAAAAFNSDTKLPPAKIPDTIKAPSKAEDASSDEDSAEEPEATEAAAPKKGKSRGKHRKLEKTEAGAGEAKGMPVIPPIYQQLKAIGSELDAEIMDHDGHSDRPTGAVVSLVIGISITAVLAIFIGCRMKTVGRRIRRTGKGPYAHDADFLVNGMYL